MKVQLHEKIREGCRYLDVYGKHWLAKYNPAVDEIQLWQLATGFGLWCDGVDIVKRIN